MIGKSGVDNNPAPEELIRFIERFAISYEVFPESAVLRDHVIRQVGYAVNLYGDDERDRPLCPGDERCREILRGLYRIARWAVPACDRACQIDLYGASAALHYLKGGKGHGCVRVEIHILHAGAPDRPIYADQKRALEEMVGRLEALGVRSASNAPEAGRSSAGCA